MKALLLFLFICVGCGSDEKIVAPSPAANEKTVAPAPAPAAKEVATQSVTDNDAVVGVRLWIEDSSLTRGTSSSHLDIAESGGRQDLDITVWLIGEDGKPGTRSSDTIAFVTFSDVDTKPADFSTTHTRTSMTIPAGKSYAERAVYIEPNADTVQEDPERFNYTASVTIDGIEYTDTVALYLVDDGWKKPIATVAAGTSPVAEGTAATFTVKLCGDQPGHRYDPRGDNCIPAAAPAAGVTVNYTVSWSKSGAFYDPDNWSLYFPERVVVAGGASTATISIPTHDDAKDEPNGYVTVALGDGRHYQTCPYTQMACHAKVVVTDNDGAGAPPGEAPTGVGTAALTGLTVSPVSDEPTQLAVSWDEVDSAAKYSVRWKTGSDSYGDGEETTALSYTITGLSAGTTYTVNVAALDGSNTLLAEATASGDTAQRTSGAGSADATPAVSFVIYYNPDGGAASADRYNQAVALLKEAGISYRVVRGDVRAEVDRLAGVTNSIMPRFFLGDPKASDWTSQPGENNGGLRWLKKKVAELSDD